MMRIKITIQMEMTAVMGMGNKEKELTVSIQYGDVKFDTYDIIPTEDPSQEEGEYKEQYDRAYEDDQLRQCFTIIYNRLIYMIDHVDLARDPHPIDNLKHQLQKLMENE